jgi:hypothetical protein
LASPAGLFRNGFQFVSFLTILSSSILCMCPNHLSPCVLIQRTIFTPPSILCMCPNHLSLCALIQRTIFTPPYILCMCPNHLSLCALIQRTIFTPPAKLSNSQFVLILQLSWSLTGP